MWMYVVCVYVDGELEKLLAEVNGELEVCSTRWRKGSASDICIYVLYPFIEGKRERMGYICYVWYTFIEGRRVWMVYTYDVRVNVCVPYSCIRYVIYVWCCWHRKSWLLCDKFINTIIDDYRYDIRIPIHRFIKKSWYSLYIGIHWKHWIMV